MNVILVMVQSVNGKITKGSSPNIYTWTSKEDQDFFFSLLQKHNLTVMGNTTYQASKGRFKLSDKRLRIILTRHPESYEAEHIPGKIEFTNATPVELLASLEKRGYKQLLLVGGGEMNTLFLRENLVDEVYLSVEPLVFGAGKDVFATGDAEASLQLLSVKQLNRKGTLLLHYRLDK
ncbi:MAG: dihydrofolate reductase family protein [bacterium]|nr:dihydrofolate reductase family protein [bacterium]